MTTARIFNLQKDVLSRAMTQPCSCGQVEAWPDTWPTHASFPWRHFCYSFANLLFLRCSILTAGIPQLHQRCWQFLIETSPNASERCLPYTLCLW